MKATVRARNSCEFQLHFLPKEVFIYTLFVLRLCSGANQILEVRDNVGDNVWGWL